MRPPLLMALMGIGSARADAEADQAAIAARLRDFTAAFNARDVAGACDIFASDLVSTMRGRPDNGREAVCKRIAAALADRGKTMLDAPDIEEIIVSGDLAVVRLIWNVAETEGGAARVSHEPGVDVFRRQPDGKWSIARFATFPPDENSPAP